MAERYAQLHGRGWACRHARQGGSGPCPLEVVDRARQSDGRGDRCRASHPPPARDGAVRRLHKRMGIEMASLTLAARLAHALNEEYALEHGVELLQPRRTEPDERTSERTN